LGEFGTGGWRRRRRAFTDGCRVTTRFMISRTPSYKKNDSCARLDHSGHGESMKLAGVQANA
jgi:hypothetical protein